MKTVSGKNIRQGQTIYLVRSYCANSYIEPIRIQSVDFIDQDDPFIRSTDNHCFYLNDLNIKGGGYSTNKCFYSRRRAISYLKTCMRRPWPKREDLSM